MRQIDEYGRRALIGSRAGDKIVAFARYGSTVHPDPIPISRYAFSWDATRQIQSLSCTVADNTGALAPWLLEDPLGVGGAVLDVRYEIGGTDTQINLGPYRIAQNRPKERWLTYIIDNKGQINPDSQLGKDKQLKFVPGGATIELTAYDLGLTVKKDRLIAPESPPVGTSPTVVSEVTRLMRDICGVVVADGVTDVAVSPNIVYERERLDAVQDLCKRIFCDYRFTGEGLLEIYSILEQDPVETLRGGPEGMLVSVDRSQDLEGLYNRFVVDGTRELSDGKTEPVRGIVDIDSGVLSIHGPHGRVPEFYSSTMITSQAQADSYATQMALSQITGLTIDLAVEALPMPHLQHGDWVTVANPVVDGEPVPLVGRIKSMDLKSGNGTAPSTMTLIVQCSYWTVQSVIGAGRSRFGH